MHHDRETTRKDLRKQLIQWRQDNQERLSREAAQALRERLLCWLSRPAFEQTGVLGVYWPIHGEPDLRPCQVHWRARGKTLALPRVGADGVLEFGRWDTGADLRPDRFSIPVPEPFRPVVPDLLIVPCVGFDARGYRLGYGGGHYDRTLSRYPVHAVGVAWDACELSGFVPAAHDRPLDVVITETRIVPGAAGGPVDPPADGY